jgi:hypothetical protein
MLFWIFMYNSFSYYSLSRFFMKGSQIMGLRLVRFSMLALVAVYFLSQVGCIRQPPRVVPPSIDADDAGTLAVETYDANKDGKISGGELDKVPGLKDSLAQLNSNREKGMTAADVTARIKAWQETRVGRMTLTCLVTRNGKPLDGAEVKFVPEKFLGDRMPEASGKTKADGYAMISAPVSGPDDVPGVPPGYYKVEITKSGDNIPAKYNTQTIFGVEVAPDTRRMSDIVFDIK